MKLFSKVLVGAMLLLITVGVFAGAWGYHGPKRDVVTLIVTANYEQPRLLAELIQNESRQPYLLLPARDKGHIYFCPPKKFGKVKVVPRESFSRNIAFIAPKQIIVLGNNNYVPDYYVAALRKIAPVHVIDSETWQAAADSLAPSLNLSKLPNSYRKLSSQLSEGKFYVPDPQKRNKINNAPTKEELSLDSAIVVDTPAFPAETKEAPKSKVNLDEEPFLFEDNDETVTDATVVVPPVATAASPKAPSEPVKADTTPEPLVK